MNRYILIAIIFCILNISLYSGNNVFADTTQVEYRNGADIQSDNYVAPTTTDTSSTDNILGISKERLRTGNITYTDIPLMIVSAIEFLLGVAGSISVVALIYHAVRMQLASGITGDASGVDKAKKGMYGAMLGFVLSMSGWFLMTKFVALLSGSV